MKKFLIIIDGPNGAGKSTVARELHKSMKLTAFIHWDTIKKTISSFEPTPHHHKIAGDVAIAMAEAYLKNGISVIYEAFFGTKENIEKVLKLTSNDVVLLVYQIEAPFEVRKERIKSGVEKRGDRKRVLSDEHMKRNDEMYKKEKYPHAKVFDSSKMTTQEIVEEIRKDIEK